MRFLVSEDVNVRALLSTNFVPFVEAGSDGKIYVDVGGIQDLWILAKAVNAKILLDFNGETLSFVFLERQCRGLTSDFE